MSTAVIVSSLMFVFGLIFTGAAIAWMYFCYFPGGYKRSEVIDIGELALYNAQLRAKGDKYEEEKGGVDGDYDDDSPDSGNFHQRALDSLYYDMEKGSAYTDGNATTDGLPTPGNRTWGSDGASEMDSDDSSYTRPSSGHTDASRLAALY